MKIDVALRIFVIVCFVLLLWVGCASAATLVVNQTSPACTKGDFYCDTIQKAVDMAEDGDIIVVCPGIYVENIKVGKSLMIQSENGSDSTIVRAKDPWGHVFKVTADYVKINGFTVEGATEWTRTGIYLYNADHCNISNNNCSKNWDGIFLEYSNNNSISNNICSNIRRHTENGIGLEYSNNNSIYNNSCLNNNTIGIYLGYSNNNSISNNNCSDNWEGIHLKISNSSSIVNNICSYNSNAGIFLWYSNNNSIPNNNCSPNNGDGIELYGSDNNSISNNNCSNNEEGINLDFSDNNSISNNNCSNDTDGIYLWDSNNNIISNNNCPNNRYGIYLTWSSDSNLIYLNNFINNTDNVYSSESTNAWSSTSKIPYTYKGKRYTNCMGNYWSDYKGTDADEDGIGDAPYSVNMDRYPLMETRDNYIALFENYTIVLFSASIAYFPKDPRVGTEIIFEASASPGPGVEVTSYIWDFGDQTPLVKGQTVSHIYAGGGYHTINLTVVTNKGNGTAKVTITVLPFPVQLISQNERGKIECLGSGKNVQMKGGKVVWQCYDGNDTEILFYNGQNVTLVTDNNCSDTLPHVYNGGVFWNQGENVRIKKTYTKYACVGASNCWIVEGPEITFSGTQAQILLKDGEEITQLSLPGYETYWQYIKWLNGTEVTSIHYEYNPYGVLIGKTVGVIGTDYYGGDYISSNQLYDDQAVWVGRELPPSNIANNGTIFFYDGQNTIQLTDGTYDARHPQVHNGQVAWEGYDGNDWEIFFYDGQKVTQLTDNDYDEELVQIDNGWVLWRHNDGNDYEGFLYDGEKIIPLTHNDYDDWSFGMDNCQVVWAAFDGNDYEIFLYNGQETIQLTDNLYDDNLPAIHKGQIAWKGFDGNDYEVFFYNGKDIIQLTENEVDDRAPRIYDGQIAWLGFDGHDFEVFLYDGKEVMQLTDNDYDECLPLRIDNGYLTWQDGNNSIYFYTPFGNLTPIIKTEVDHHGPNR